MIKNPIRFLKTENLVTAIAFSLPLWPQLTIALTACWLLISIRRIPYQFTAALRHPALRWNVLLFMALSCGLLWTHDIPSGMKELKDEAYLLVFAVLFAGGGLSHETGNRIRMSLVYGSVTAGMICLLAATVRYASSGLPGEFFYTSFSILLHPTYFGLLLLTSCIFLGEEMSRLEARQRTLKQYLILTANLCMLALLGSKINYLGIVLIGLLILFISLKKRNFTLYKDRRLLVAGAGGLLFFLVITSYFNRSTQVIQAVTEKSGTTLSPADQIMVDSSGYNSTTIRIAQWKYSLELGSNMPFYGVGTGDEVEDLRSVFRKHNDPYALLHFGHAHSHYLHYWLMLGVAGFLLVLFSLVIPLIRAIKQGDHATLCFFSLLLLIGLTDILSHATIGACYAFISGLLPTEDKKN